MLTEAPKSDSAAQGYEPLVMYFGCIDAAGHYLWESENNRLVNGFRYGVADRFFRCLDGGFNPPEGWHTQVYMRSTVPPWVILSWWDNSVDSRPGSHSTFLFRGFTNSTDDKELMALAKEKFPSVFSRQREPIRALFPFEKPGQVFA